MDGIQFVTNDNGRKTAAVIDLKKHKQLWEDIYDGLICKDRRNEKSIPYDSTSQAGRNVNQVAPRA